MIQSIYNPTTADKQFDWKIVNVKSSFKVKYIGKSTLDFVCKTESDAVWLQQHEILSFVRKLNFYVLRKTKSSLTFTLFTTSVESFPPCCHINVTGHTQHTQLDLDNLHLRLLNFLTEAAHQHAQARGEPLPHVPELVDNSDVIDCLTTRLRLRKELNLMLLAHDISTQRKEISVSFNPTTFSGLILRHNKLKTCILHRRVALFFGQKSTNELSKFLDLLQKWKLI